MEVLEFPTQLPTALEVLSTVGTAALERLRLWRSFTAGELGLPPYVIFLDSTLRAIASRMPRRSTSSP
jgi:ATP-dependent DNA helicase RecQ